MGILLILLLVVVVLLLLLLLASVGQLTPDFYASTCPQLASIVAEQVYQAAQADPRMPASLVRLHFHDCFVNGCDGSVLLSGYEQLAGPNLNSIRGLNVIADIKAAVEQACPATVSCADILAIAARDSVVLASKPLCNPGWTVLLGRRDSLTASEEAANVGIPGPFLNVEQLNANFANVGLSPQDVVVLSGAHTFGKVHCSFFSDRLYNFNNTFRPDPTMDPAQVTLLRSVCPRIFPGLGGTVSLDQGTRFIFDNSFYQELQQNRGILQMDQELSRDPTTAVLVSQLAAPDSNFTTIFGQAMVKLGNVGVLTGARGEIRKICSQIN
ncbi:unnamed protein product [Sphagnum troendelagicum]|uniref:Peroxidase n=1 Tax=Sphagnum troendelagicum TaxID=128251 RepID=A0ABP0TNN8_9BRYO